jgi:predicted dehydrogenase
VKKLRVAVLGAGTFGRNHIRVISELADVELTAIVDTDVSKAEEAARGLQCNVYSGLECISPEVDAAIVATPTITHEPVAMELLDKGLDLLVEKPMAPSSAAGKRISDFARERGRILQVGHLERFNPAVVALEKTLTVPLFFEIHRLSVFSPRSLDVNVILDLMIHDLEIILSFTGQEPSEVRAAGISVLSNQVDIANVRLSFPSGCVANLTASRVSTEKVRKLRLFQPGEYISVDYQRQDAIRLKIDKNEPKQQLVRQSHSEGTGFASQDHSTIPQIGFESLPVKRDEPLRLELEAFFRAVRERSQPRVDGFAAVRSLRLAEQIADNMKEHGDLVAETLRQRS